MATKKQKRAAALARREEYLEQIRQEGLAAQRREAEAREAESQSFVEEVETIKLRHGFDAARTSLISAIEHDLDTWWT